MPRHAPAPRAVAARRRCPPGLAAAGPSPGGAPLCLGRSPSAGPGTPPRPGDPRSTGQSRWRVAAPEIYLGGADLLWRWRSRIGSQLMYGLRSGQIDRSVAGCLIRCGKQTRARVGEFWLRLSKSHWQAVRFEGDAGPRRQATASVDMPGGVGSQAPFSTSRVTVSRLAQDRVPAPGHQVNMPE
jgi:hypothetical protein